ncbi:hypothetical protein BSZ19_12365 [Bradyrhizobium japonicum]|uniref:Uncharacterized protein n=1 Tax=Bradyrhizobium japonicum TaxID=375 RepID=A0A1Y2JS71_BRAJP|nr:hypothetical protein BSZ19_12365 [Bradyrhizobium japonicum]
MQRPTASPLAQLRRLEHGRDLKLIPVTGATEPRQSRAGFQREYVQTDDDKTSRREDALYFTGERIPSKA